MLIHKTNQSIGELDTMIGQVSTFSEQDSGFLQEEGELAGWGRIILDSQKKSFIKAAC